MMRNPRCCNPIGTEPPALSGSREAPTTAIVVALSRISWELRSITKSKRARRVTIPRRDKGRLAPDVRIGGAQKVPLAANVLNIVPRLHTLHEFASRLRPCRRTYG